MEQELSRRDFLCASLTILTVFGVGGVVASCLPPEDKDGKFVDKHKVEGQRVNLPDGGYRYRNPLGVGNRLHPDDVLVYLSRFHRVDRSNVQVGSYQFELEFAMFPNQAVEAKGFANNLDWIKRFEMSLVRGDHVVPLRPSLVTANQVYLDDELAEVDKVRKLVLGKVALGSSNDPDGFSSFVREGFNLRLGRLEASVGMYSFNSHLKAVETYRVK